MFHIKQRTAQPHSWHIGRHQKTPKSIHASGTSGRRHHVVTEPRLAFRHKTSGLSASRDDGAVFLTAANTNKRSVRRGFLLTLRGFLLRTLDVYKVSLPEIPAGILVFGFQFLSFPYKTKTTTRPRLQRYFLDQSTSSEGETTVALDWLFDRIWSQRSKSNTSTPRTNLLTC